MYDPRTDSYSYGPDLSGVYSDSPGFTPPLPDVSQTGPDSAPSTPTANGYGYYVDPAAQSSTFDLAKDALRYALNMDQQRIGGYQAGGFGQVLPSNAQYSAVMNAQQMQSKKNMQLLLLVGVGLFVLAHHG